MLFNSIDFAIFVPIVFFLYWFVAYKNLKLQNLFIVLASYTFYGWWDYRFLALIGFSTVIDYSIGVGLQSTKKKLLRKTLLGISIFSNLLLLGIFKYYDFFIDNFVSTFAFFGKSIQVNSPNIILPVGISFYTFQTLSYTIDVYRKKISATNDFVIFSAFVSFFPQLVAGPIERATNLLPQFQNNRIFEYHKAVDGMRQVLWGLFKKVVIADNCAALVNQIFINSNESNGSTLLLGAIFFSFQIYGDFSGYSDIAIGISRLFGFDLMQNFAFPYFSRDIAEFWRRWHISLSTWFRDYLYIPLGGSRKGTGITIRNIFIIFIVSGFWHGASWTFVVWGALNAILFLPLLLANLHRRNIGCVAEGRWFPSVIELFLILLNFVLVTVLWVFFRSESIGQAVNYIATIFSASLFSMPSFQSNYDTIKITIFIIIFMLTEWFGREHPHALANLVEMNRLSRHLLYYVIIFSIFWMGGIEQEFIYFQF